jgi:uncharacterized protein
MAIQQAVDNSRHTNSPYQKLQPLPLSSVRIGDEFWAPRLGSMRDVTLPEQYAQCERSGRIDNFRRAAGKISGPFQGLYFNDSDVYKWLEAAAYALAGQRDPGLEQTVDAVIAELAAAQQPDGYLNTYFALERAGERWSDLLHKHELYCAGHLIQAAVAHQRATGKRTLLDVAIRYADLICRTFGPDARHATDGHEEIELALVALYRATGNHTYLDRARFFLDQRGQQPPVLNGASYLQDHLPVREQREAVGHAVRATYLACGMLDVYAETGEDALLQAAKHLWESAFRRKAYVTGGLGARHEGEAFGADYELPNERAYAETCAAIGGFLWSWRLLLTTGAARYADWMEMALYNGILAGLSLDGTEYFYVNPLADRGDHRRQPWFSCACCPPNLARLLMSLPGYLASTSAEGLWLHLYAAGSVQATLPNGDALALEIATRYPWEGDIRLDVTAAPEAATTLFLRLPAWCTGATLTVNGESTTQQLTPGAYLPLRRRWQAGDTVTLTLPMPARRLAAHPHVLADQGRVALARGPLVYCLEGADHPGVDVWDVTLPPLAELQADPAPDLLDGVVVLRGEGVVEQPAAGSDGLYHPTPSGVERRPVPLTFIPYYAWANRAAGPMLVWLREG